MQQLKYLITCALLLCAFVGNAKKSTVSGFVNDKNTGERLVGAHVFDIARKIGVATDYNGYFCITIDSASALQFSYLGCKSVLLRFKNSSDTLVNVNLDSNNELESVIVTAKFKPKPNVSTLSSAQMQQIPSLGGKPDLGKSLQLLPGITSQNEGSSVLLVRGGDPGQNLYLFDNIPVTYVNHLGGFMSVFNADIINNIDVYKSGFPARYGGKISSVVDITQKDGDSSGVKGSLGIGLTDLSFSLEGPTKIKNSSFILVGRKTIIDPYMALASSLSQGADFTVAYGFHDLNGKFAWKPNVRNSLSLNFYQGDDYLNYSSRYKNSTNKMNQKVSHIWGNLLVSAHWKKIVTPNLYCSNSISYTRYRLKDKQEFALTSTNDTIGRVQKDLSWVKEGSFRSAWKYSYANFWQLDFGLQSSVFSYNPNERFVSDQKNWNNSEKVISVENAIYAENSFSILKKHDIILGLRAVNTYTGSYINNSLEPRLTANFAVSPSHVVSANYMHTHQPSHLIFTMGSIMNNEVWIPAEKSIPAATSNQYSVSWLGQYKNNRYSSEVNFYHKQMSQLATFKEGFTKLSGDENWRSKIETNGTGYANGVEFLLKKNHGDLTGFMSYAYSKTMRQFPTINNGNAFSFDYDRPNTLSVLASYKINNKLSINAAWIFQSGLPYTPAIGRQLVQSTEPNDDGEPFYYDALIYGAKNSDRMKNYHRLDVGLTYQTVTKKRHNKAIWSFSVYNVYNRQNANYYYYNNINHSEIHIPEFGESFKPVQLYQISMFPIIPTVSYKLFFDGNRKTEKIKKTPFKQKINNWLYHEN